MVYMVYMYASIILLSLMNTPIHLLNIKCRWCIWY